jgi:CheY-like chemotaxis protein
MNILLVDDNDDVREITALFLRDSGYNVLEASSGSAALDVLDANPAINLLIVDFAMPKMSGTELVERVRAAHPELRAVFITGYDDHPQINGILANEMVVRKPFTADQLVFAVRRVSPRNKH